MVVGDVDTGKTTFCASLLGRLSCRERVLAFIDADVGQSTVGPPGTVSLSILRGTFLSFRYLEPAAIRFIGDVSPAGHVARVVAHVGDLADLAGRAGAWATILDTTGLFHGPEGTELKRLKVARVKPEHIVLVQKEPVSAGCAPDWLTADQRVLRVGVAPCVRRRCPAERTAYRRRCFARYLRGTRRVRIGLGDALLERCQAAELAGQLHGLLVGLLDANGEMLALGVALRVAGSDLVTSAPEMAVGDIARVELGSCRLDPEQTCVPFDPREAPPPAVRAPGCNDAVGRLRKCPEC
jgi:polynucleotide 5'-kinase involved in rRNA processing